MLEIVEPLSIWYQKYKRDLPWRKDQDPYHIWISEIMLQQTRVEAVKVYYERFIKEIPDIESLSKISEEKLLKLWEGLGYYSRAKNLQKAAIKIMEEYQGEMPSSYQEIITLPGIGEYTAGAIASIAFQEKVPAIDGNVFRVMMRLENSKRNISKSTTKKEVFRELLAIMPEESHIFNQALMELGAMICIPNGVPYCEKCPLAQFCKAKQENTMLELPIKEEKKKKEIEEYTVFILLNYHNVAIHKRDKTGLLASMYEFPNVNRHLAPKEVLQYLKEKGYTVFRIIECDSSKHIFTHKIWNMKNYIIYVEEPKEEFEWMNIQTLIEEYALARAFSSQLEMLKQEVKEK